MSTKPPPAQPKNPPRKRAVTLDPPLEQANTPRVEQMEVTKKAKKSGSITTDCASVKSSPQPSLSPDHLAVTPDPPLEQANTPRVEQMEVTKKATKSGSKGTDCASAKSSPQPSLSPDQMEAIKSRRNAYLGKGAQLSHNGKAKSKSGANRVYHQIHYCLTKDRGCICTWTEHPRIVGNQGFSGKAFSELQREPDVKKACHIDHLATWRAKDSPIAFKTAGPDNDFPYNIMVRCVADPSNCTIKNAEKWISKILIPYFNRKGKEYARIPSIYQMGNDMTTDPPSPLSEIVTRPDVFQVIELAYPNMHLHELLDIPSALSLYFPDEEQGKCAISGKQPGEEASSGDEF
jgi:hypothetical protein